jgi:hypothetical protein
MGFLSKIETNWISWQSRAPAGRRNRCNFCLMPKIRIGAGVVTAHRTRVREQMPKYAMGLSGRSRSSGLAGNDAEI